MSHLSVTQLFTGITVLKESSYIYLYIIFSKRFKNRQDENVSGLSTSARVLRKRRNLVSMRFNMINWLLETTSLILVIIKVDVFLTIFYLLVNSCGTPLVILFILFVLFHYFLFRFTFWELRKTGRWPGSTFSHALGYLRENRWLLQSRLRRHNFFLLCRALRSKTSHTAPNVTLTPTERRRGTVTMTTGVSGSGKTQH